MSRYVAGRLAEMVPVLVLITIAAFALLHLTPGDPARIALGTTATPEAVAELRRELGLDESLHTQYWDFVRGAVTFDFGTSLASGEDVSTVISRRLGPSLLLIAYALLVSTVAAVALAIVAAVRRRTWVDQAVRLGSTVAFVMPVFWLALLMVTIFSLQLNLFPTSGYGDTFGQHLLSLTLPAVTIGLFLAPLLMRLLRSNLIETLQSEYVEAARVRGLSERRVILKHVMRNSVTSGVTFLGVVAGILLSSTVIVEEIFAIPGLGSLLVDAVGRRDFPVVRALTLLFAVTVLVVSLATDLIYAMLDPRVRLQG